MACQDDISTNTGPPQYHPIVKSVTLNGQLLYSFEYDQDGFLSRQSWYLNSSTQPRTTTYQWDDPSFALVTRASQEDTLLTEIEYKEVVEQKQNSTIRKFDSIGNVEEILRYERIYFADGCGIQEEKQILDDDSECVWRRFEKKGNNCNTIRFTPPCAPRGSNQEYQSHAYYYDDRNNAYGHLFELGRGHLTKLDRFDENGVLLANQSYESTLIYNSNGYPIQETKTYVSGQVDILEFFY